MSKHARTERVLGPARAQAITGKTEKGLSEFFRALNAARSGALLLDYDGTLAPFRLDRFQARPYAGVRELLERIQAQGRTRMVFITGRPAGEIGPLLGLATPVEVWGLHGAERLLPNGRRVLDKASPAAAKKLDDLRAHLRRDSFGGLFEDKANGAVMHWRGEPARKAQAIERKARALFQPLAAMGGFTLLEFESGLELRTGRDKGEAVEAILADAGSDLPAAFLGDDITDEAAFRAVNSAANPSLSVLVRRERRRTDARLWLRPPAELRSFLRRWIAATES